MVAGILFLIIGMEIEATALSLPCCLAAMCGAGVAVDAELLHRNSLKSATTADITQRLITYGLWVAGAQKCLQDHGHHSSSNGTSQRTPVGWFCLTCHASTMGYCSFALQGGGGWGNDQVDQVIVCTMVPPVHYLAQPKVSASVSLP